MRQNIKLLAAIREKGWKQKDLAEKLGKRDTLISSIIRGRWNLNEAEKRRVAEVLGKKVEELF
jgi:ribosome-binding protein aMBF1 (putative translation factor)